MIAGETHNLNAGALAPVQDEVSIQPRLIEGNIPRELNGSLIRNGPNPFSGAFSGHDVLDWWPEAAMVHSIRFDHGTVTQYANRWVRTAQWANYHNSDATHLVEVSLKRLQLIGRQCRVDMQYDVRNLRSHDGLHVPARCLALTLFSA